MSVPNGKSRVDGTVAVKKGKTAVPKIQKPLIELEPLPRLAALAEMAPAERAKVSERIARNIAATKAHFKAKHAASENAKSVPAKSKRKRDGKAAGSVVKNGSDEETDDTENPTALIIPATLQGSNEVPVDVDDDDDDDDTADSAALAKWKAEFNAFEDSHFQTNRQQRQEGLFTPAWCDRVTKTLAESRVLGQLAHWFAVSRLTGKCRAKIEEDGYLWIYKHYPALARETRLTEKQVGDSMRNLIANGIVVIRQDANHGRLLRLNPIKIEAILQAREEHDDQ